MYIVRTCIVGGEERKGRKPDLQGHGTSEKLGKNLNINILLKVH